MLYVGTVARDGGENAGRADYGGVEQFFLEVGDGEGEGGGGVDYGVEGGGCGADGLVEGVGDRDVGDEGDVQV